MVALLLAFVLSTGAESASALSPAPSSPALAGSGVDQAPSDGATGVASQDDWLQQNGMVSPTCERAAAGRQSLDIRSTSNCRNSGSVAIPANAGNFDVDTHINVGVMHIRNNFFDLLQEILVHLPWRIALAIYQGLIVLVEWAFGFNLLDPTTMGGLARELNRIKEVFTLPLLRITTVVGAGWFAYMALARGRIAHAIGSSAQAFVISVLLLLVLANPIGLVGKTSTLVRSAAVQVVALLSLQQPETADESLRRNLQVVVDQTLTPAFSYLEFGNVEFGIDPKHKDPRLALAARMLAAGGSSQERDAVRVAHNNAELFLAFKANSDERNSLNKYPSLLHILCGRMGITNSGCSGPLARYAHARDEHATWDRVLAIIVILASLACIWLVLAWVALRLIYAAVMALVHVLLASIMAPVAWISDAARTMVVSYLNDFAGSIVAVLYYGVILGIVFDLFRILQELQLAGYIVQTFIYSIAMVAIWRKRRALFRPGGLARLSHERLGEQVSYRVRDRARRAVHRAEEQFPRARQVRQMNAVAIGAWLTRRARTRRSAAADPSGASALSGHPRDRAQPASAAARGRAAREVTRQEGTMLHAARIARLSDAPTSEESQQVAAQLQRREGALLAATRGPGQEASSRERQQLRRRELSLGRRRDQSLAQQRRLLERADRARRAAKPLTDGHWRRTAAWLDRQSALPRGLSHRRQRIGMQRDYPQLTGVIGLSPRSYTSASNSERLQMRNRIDRELRRRALQQQALEPVKSESLGSHGTSPHGARPPGSARRRDGSHPTPSVKPTSAFEHQSRQVIARASRAPVRTKVLQRN